MTRLSPVERGILLVRAEERGAERERRRLRAIVRDVVRAEVPRAYLGFIEELLMRAMKAPRRSK